MSETQAQNPFQPPRAAVHDHQAPAAGMVLAEPGKRLLAVIVDALPSLVVLAILAAAMLPMLLPALKSDEFSEAMDHLFADRAVITRLIAVGAVLTVAGVAWGIYNIVLVYRYGQTFGKKVLGIRMVRTDGSRMSFARYFFLRNVVFGLLCAIPYIGVVVRLVDKLLIFRDSRQCLHDTLADTTVATAESSPNATLAGSRLRLPTMRF